MKNPKRELIFLRTVAITLTVGMLTAATTAIKTANQKFGTIDVERINVVEKDGTVKMVITNANHFPISGRYDQRS